MFASEVALKAQGAVEEGIPLLYCSPIYLRLKQKGRKGELRTSLQNMADSTDAVGWSPILPSVKSVGVGRRRGKASVMSVGHQVMNLVGDQSKVTKQR